MNLNRWPEITEEFDRLKDLPASEREKALDLNSDAELKSAVRELLEAHDACEQAAGGFLDRPALADATTGMLSLVAGHPLLNRVVGRFRLIRQIGEGGMGTVFEAVRADAEFEQRVAVKVIRTGMDRNVSGATKFNLERFRRERQILADLNHPNVARLFDGGTTDDGLPYIVMELIEGEHIDSYCETRNTPVEGRLRLFQSVCNAVHYAHQRQVIHRDIKPGNILVTADGTVKLLDFGIAKSFDPNTPSKVTQTERMASPHYASPEQLTGGAITTATDVYSLGAVLRELVGPEPSASLERIIRKATAVEARMRYGSAEELSGDIGRVISGAKIHAGAGKPWVRSAIAIAATSALAVAGYLSWSLWSPKPPHAIAVVHFENLSGDPALDWLDSGMCELLTTGLAQSGAFEVISTERVRSVVRRLGPSVKVTTEIASDVARDSHADLFVAGTLMKSGEGVRVDVRVQETKSGKVVFGGWFQGAGANGVFGIADRATAGIVARLAAGAGNRSESRDAHVTQVLTANAEALQAYMEGRRWFDRFRYPEARAAFDRAIALDPNFIMAYVKRAEIAGPWNRAAARSELAIASKLAEAHPLPLFQQRVLQAKALLADGRLDDVEAIAEALTRDFPRESEPLMLLSLASTARGDWPKLLRSAQAGVAVDNKDPNLSSMLIVARVMTGNREPAHQEIERYCSLLEAGDWNCQDWWGDTYVIEERWEDALAAYAKYRGKWNQSVFKPVLVHLIRGSAGDYERGIQLARIAPAEYPMQPVTKPISEFMLGNLDAAQGKLEDAVQHYEESAKLYQNRSFAFDQLFKAAQIYLELGQLGKVLELASRHDTPWTAALRGMAYQALKNHAAAETEYAALRASLTPLLGDYSAVRTERLYRLNGAFYAGDYKAVVEALPGIPVEYRSLYALPAGRALLALGRLEDARKELQYLYGFRLVIGAPTHYEQYAILKFLLARFYLGEIAEKSGRKDEARRIYREFLGRFDKSELPQVNLARQRAGG